MRLEKNQRRILTIVIFLISLILFYFRFLFLYKGYSGYDNFVIPYHYNEFNWSIFFDSHLYNTTVITTPESTFFVLIAANIPYYLLSFFVSINVAAKAFTVLAALFYMLSVYFLASIITSKYYIRIIGSCFLTFNPYVFMDLSIGVSLGFVAQGFVYLSIGFLIKSLKSKRKLPNFSWLLSICFLAISIMGFQSFVLGVIAYFITLVLFSYGLDSPDSLTNCFKKTSYYIVLGLPILIALILPDVYPLYAGNITSEFIFNPGLSSFVGNSTPPLNLLLLKGYPPNLAWLSALSAGYTVFYLWESLEIFLLIFLLIAPIVFRRYRLFLISIIVILLSLIGAGADSPLFSVNSYLYLHFPGFGSLNASYFWEWIISLFYFYLIIFILEVSEKFMVEKTQLINQKKSFRIWLVHHSGKVRLFIILIVLFVLVTPISTQGYYSSSGINNQWAQNLPTTYSEIQPELSKLIGNSSGGVAYFNPDILLYKNNTSNWFINPNLAFSKFRVAELSNYGSPHTPSNRFFYWVYSLFYNNETKYLGQLMSFAGIEYFVILNNTNSWTYNQSFMPFSEGINATQLMKYQQGIRLLYSGSGYSIYKNLDYFGTADNYSNLTLISGGFQELAILPYFGFNISRLGIVFTSDITSSNYEDIMTHVKYIILQDSQGLQGIALRSIGQPIQLPIYATSSSPSNGWTSTTNVQQSDFHLFDSVTPTAVAYGNESMTVPLENTFIGNYSIWVQTYVSSISGFQGGSLELSVGSANKSFDTFSSTFDLSNVFLWYRLNTYLSTNVKLEIHSVNGWNAIREAFLIPNGELRPAMANLNSTISLHHIQVIQAMSGQILAPTDSKLPNLAQQIIISKSNSYINGNSAFLTNFNGLNTSLRVYSAIPSGIMYIKALHYGFSGGLLNISTDINSYYVGVDPQNYSSQQNSSLYYMAIPVKGPSYSVSLTLDTAGFTFNIDGILFSQTGIKAITPIPIRGNFNLTGFSSDNSKMSMNNISTNQTVNNNTINFEANIHYVGPSPGYQYESVVTLYYNFPFPYNDSSIRESMFITKGFYVLYNSLRIGNTNGTSIYLSGNSYGSMYREKYLTISIYTMNNINNNTEMNLSFSLSLKFLSSSSIYHLNLLKQVLNEYNLSFTDTGYSFALKAGITIIHLPYYNLMTQNNRSIERYSVAQSLAQLLFTKHSTGLDIQVNYVNDLFIILCFDAIMLTALSLKILFKRQKGETDKRDK